MIRTCTTAVMTGLGVIAAAVSCGTAVAAASPGVAPAASTSTAINLADLLLHPEDVAAIIGAKSMRVLDSSTSMVDTSAQVAPAACVSTWSPGEQQSYAASGYTGVQTQTLMEATPAGAAHVVNQTVVSFPTSAQASDYITHAAADWLDCAGRTLDYTAQDGQHTTWVIGKPALDAKKTLLALPQATQDGATGCERALTMKTNVVVDVLACTAGDDATGQGVSLAANIVANMPYSI